MKLEVSPVFSYPIAEIILENIDSTHIVDVLQKEKYRSTMYSQNNNEDVDILISENLNIIHKFPLLHMKVQSALKTYVGEVMQYGHIKYKITTSWATITPPGGRCQRHMHSNSWISGIYYPKTFNQGGDIKFYSSKNRFFSFGPPNEINLFNSMEHSYTPAENMLLLFDSSLEHSITKNLSNYNRHSIAFNVFPIGKIGLGDSQLTFSVK